MPLDSISALNVAKLLEVAVVSGAIGMVAAPVAVFCAATLTYFAVTALPAYGVNVVKNAAEAIKKD